MSDQGRKSWAQVGASRSSGGSQSSTARAMAPQNRTPVENATKTSSFTGSRPNNSASSRAVPMPESVQHSALVKQSMPCGNKGDKIDLVGNFFRLITTGLVVYHYDLNVTKAKPTETTETDKPKKAPNQTGFDNFIKKLTPTVVKAFIAENPSMFAGIHFVYDGNKNMYSAKQLKLPYEVFELDHTADGRRNKFVISIKLVAKIDLSEVDQYYGGKNKKGSTISEKTISVYDLIFRFVQEKHFASYQRAFYDISQRKYHERVRLFDFVPGFVSSVRLTEFGLALNIHLKTTCMVSAKFKTLDQFVVEILKISKAENLEKLTYAQCRTATRMVRHLQVQTNHTNSARTYMVDSISQKTPYEHTFNKTDGTGALSIADYFKAEYGLILKRYPLVKTTGGVKANYLPMELCQMGMNQFVADSKYDSFVQAELLTNSKVDPNVYFDKVTKIVQQIELIDPELLNGFNIKIACKPAKFPGRVLPLPKILQVRNGFCQPASVPTRWGLFSFDDSCTDKHLENFVNEMRTKAKSMKLEFSNPSLMTYVQIKDVSQIGNVFGNLKKRAVEYIFVVIPVKHESINSQTIYNMVKLHCDQEYEITCSCINGDRLKMVPRGYFDNFLLKVNGKLGGQNCLVDPNYISQLPFKMTETMVVGVDVNHPGATEKVISSVAAAVGSYNHLMSLYSASIRVQKKERDEMVRQIDSMVRELLNEYHKHNRKYPRNVFIFRDGVSEGQFKTVMDVEIPNIRKALDQAEKGIKLTVVVVQKRHHTRFSRTNAFITDRERGKFTFNVPSGTVVDTMIVEPNIAGFLLNSHFSQLGTSKPTKYIILKDELKLSSDQLEMFCFYACHNCVRTNKTISIPSPVRYADLCAYRSKGHIEAYRAKVDGDNSSTSTSGNTQKLDPEEIQRREEEIIKQLNEWVKIKDKTKNTLYYC